MHLKNALLVFIVLFIAGCNKNVSSDKKDKSNFETVRNDELTVNPVDSVGLFTEQEIRYIAPQSGSVYLVWKSENYPLEKSLHWNDNTTLTDGLLYIPMEAKNDTFTIRLKVPAGSTFQYYFWITKNKQGHYQDFWDLQSSGKINVTDAEPIIKNAVYTKVEEKKESQILTSGWWILLILIIIYIILYWIAKTWISEIKSTSFIEKVFFLGLGIAVFHVLARSEIINYSFLNILHHPRTIVKILRGSFQDLLFVSLLTVFFILILWWIKNVKLKKLVYGIYLFFAMFSILVAFSNITIVIFLGKPFTYQWLYYSDFLGSNEAKTAFLANLSSNTALNLIMYCVSAMVLAKVLLISNQLLSVQIRLKNFVYLTLGTVLAFLMVLAVKTKVTWTEGQSENAIVTMVHSVYTANSNSSFYSADIPVEMEPFDPAKCTAIESYIDSLKENKVKNVLFIILESAGAAYFDDFGGTFQLSPNLSRYAKQSIIFNQMYAHAPATNRSLVAILASMYPYLSYKSLTQEAPGVIHPTISSVLKSKGYRTSFFSSADLRFQNCREFLSFREFDVIEDFSAIQCSEEFRLESKDYVEGNGIDDICLSDRLTNWVDEDTTKNFFSMIWTVQGHYPYFFAGKEEDFGVSNLSFNRYLNCLKHNDELVGKVMKSLEDRGLASSTLVVVVGDHGEAFGQHQQYGHGTAIYEENLRVPLYFINSTLFNGEIKSDIAGMKDLATTALSVINVDIPNEWQGRNLLNTTSDEAFYFAPWSDYLFGYRKSNKKFIFNESRNTVEVYDLSQDPHEKINLSQSISGEELANARNRVGAWVQFQNKYVKEMLIRKQ